MANVPSPFLGHSINILMMDLSDTPGNRMKWLEQRLQRHSARDGVLAPSLITCSVPLGKDFMSVRPDLLLCEMEIRIVPT